MELAILPDDCEREKWNEIVTSFGDHNFYQSWEWGEAKRVQGWTPLRMVCILNGDIIGAAQGFKKSLLPRGWGVLWIPGGPLVLKDGENLSAIGNLESILRTLQRRFSKEEGLIIRCAPYLFSTSMAEEILCKLGFQKLRSIAFVHTFLVDITDSMEILRMRLRKKWRYTLKQFEASHVKIQFTNSSEAILCFYRILKETEKIKKFHLSVTLEQLKILSEFSDTVRLLVAYNNERPVGGLIVTCIGKRGLELFAGATSEGYNLNVSYGLIWESIRWLKGVGAEVYDLGGVDPVGGKGVYTFKAGLRGNLVKFLGQWEHSPNWMMTIGLRLLEKLR